MNTKDVVKAEEVELTLQELVDAELEEVVGGIARVEAGLKGRRK